jgi:hypothetical protein
MTGLWRKGMPRTLTQGLATWFDSLPLPVMGVSSLKT